MFFMRVCVFSYVFVCFSCVFVCFRMFSYVFHACVFNSVILREYLYYFSNTQKDALFEAFNILSLSCLA
jgi:hypothetical protein